MLRVKEGKLPAEIKARAAVARALRRGEITREPCEECGRTRTHAHHDDYSKPLEVRWLCHKHHVGVHRDLPQIDPDKVRRARMELGLTQKELASVVGVSPRTIQQWEWISGTSRPHPRHVRSLAKVAGRDIPWFFNENGGRAA